jgi:hypothetical protein
MKWLRTLILFDRGDVVHSSDWNAIHSAYVRSIESIDNPPGTGLLTLRRKTRKQDGQWARNGVGYLRKQFLKQMVDVEKWKPEGVIDLGDHRKCPKLRLFPSLEDYSEPITSEFGNFDFTTESLSGLKIAIEWETGNISSSHRSMNKLAIALSDGLIQIGVLIVPSRKLYEHLTDRIGNIGELSGYLSLWESLNTSVKNGLFALSVVEQDELTDDPKFPYLKVGSDGRSRLRTKGTTKKQKVPHKEKAQE